MSNQMGRKIFRSLVGLEEARAILLEHFNPSPIGEEEVALEDAHGAILAEDIYSGIDVPSFPRAAVDGFAVIAQDTFGADEDKPKALRIIGSIKAGEEPKLEIEPGSAAEIATGAPMPSGANAVVMVEYTQAKGDELFVFKAVSPGENVTPMGNDIMAGELVLRRGQRIASKEVGVLAAIGRRRVRVFKKPKVAIISTGDELAEPGEALGFGKIYDVNSFSLSYAVLENGGSPLRLGVVGDDPREIEEALKDALRRADVVITSGSTSAGSGDVIYSLLDGLGRPGLLVHGLKVKPGKPAAIAVANGKPIFGLPGYPTSAMIIFTALVAPIIRSMAGLGGKAEGVRQRAKVARRIASAKGRAEFLPVHLIRSESGESLVYPILKGSGAITSFSMADGFLEIPEDQEFLEEGEEVEVELFGRDYKPADLVFIGSHCIGVDILLAIVRKRNPNLIAKVINLGSLGGIQAVRDGGADIAGIHLLDKGAMRYNIPFLERYGLVGRAILVRGYRRQQGLIVEKGNPHGIRGFEDVIHKGLKFVNRNAGSGTRLLIESWIKDLSERVGIDVETLRARVKGWSFEVNTHSAVASAVARGMADVGVGIRPAAEAHGLDFIPLAEEEYDFLIPASRIEKDSVKEFLSALRSDDFKRELGAKLPGFLITEDTGRRIL
ncbi:MAG: molybdopterin biosynthesis protein [Candidatus Bathyarchaeia archaeon]